VLIDGRVYVGRDEAVDEERSRDETRDHPTVSERGDIGDNDLREQLESAGGNDGEACPRIREALHRVNTGRQLTCIRLRR
jgi:hypothetical protein